MSVTVLDDVELSHQIIEAGVKGRQIRRNQRVSTANGFESVNIVWDKTLREYDIGIGPLRRSAWQEIEALFEVTEGGAYGFLLLDPKDSSAGTGGRVVSLGGGQYQLLKRYIEPRSARYKDRKVTRPKLSTLQVLVSGVPTSASFDATTGKGTISGSPAANLVTWTGQLYTPVHFLNDQIDWEMVAAGSDPDGRFYTGPQVTLQEIRE
jgi:uncharacterized protein (TIGR02217 family)